MQMMVSSLFLGNAGAERTMTTLCVWYRTLIPTRSTTLAEAGIRDSIIFSSCRKASVPIVWNLAGGYQPVQKTGYDSVVVGHLNTYDFALDTFR